MQLGQRANSATLAFESAKLLRFLAQMDDSQTGRPPSPARQRFLRGQPLGYFILLGVFVFLFWLGSLVFVCHRLNVPHLEQHRLQTLAQVGEAMAITTVLFSGLGFVALIATVWLQRTQVEAAIQSMEESTKAQRENLKTLHAQSDATLAAAKCSALSILVSLTQQKIDKARADWSLGRDSEEHKMLPELEIQQASYITLLKTLLEELLKKLE